MTEIIHRPFDRLLGDRSEGYECLRVMSGLNWAIILAMFFSGPGHRGS